MALVSITRLRVRSVRFAPAFIWYAMRSLTQARRSAGCLAGDVRHEKALVFWTRTVWTDLAAMRAFMRSGAHRTVMPKLLDWCDEASLVHFENETGGVPDWEEAAIKVRDNGRTSHVKHPSAAHARGETIS
jgi:Domain of unknown function (DUF3291)